MTQENLPSERPDEIAAAEYAFGLVDAEEGRAIEARVAQDEAFRATLAWWMEQATELLTGLEEAPRPSLWSQIQGRLPANDAAATPPSSPRQWGGWQLATGVATAAAVVLGVLAWHTPPPPPSPPAVTQAAPPLVAMLRGTTGKATLAVSIDRTDGRLTTTPADLAVAEHDVELWVIPADGTPRSLGVVNPDTPQWRAPSGNMLAMLVPGATLAISVEPRGGSPTGQPTGAVILTGKIAAI